MRTAVSRVQDSPAAVAAEAQEVLAGLRADQRGSEVEAVAHWAIGLACREQSHLERAESHLRQAVQVAEKADLSSLVGQIEVARALTVALRARTDEALEIVRRAEGYLEGVELARAITQRGLILQRAGLLQEAVEAYSLALPSIQDGSDRLGEARLLINRGLAHAYSENFANAEDDLRAARDIARSLDQSLMVMWCDHNLGFVFGRRGNAIASLDHFERAYQSCIAMDVPGATTAVTLIDRADVLAGVGLVSEAMSHAARARQLLAATDNEVELAETELLLARVALIAGDCALALETAVSAENRFISQGRVPWAALARSISFRSREGVHGALVGESFIGHAGAGPRNAGPLAREGAGLSADLTDAGWDADARIVATLAGRLWRLAGADARAIEQLEPVAAGRRRGSAINRVQSWQAEALIRMIRGDRAGARRAIRAGLDTIAAFRTTMAATDLRATVSSIGDELASWLVELALDGGKPRDVLGAAEAWRAGSLVAPVAAPDDAELERLLGELRATDADRRTGQPGVEARRARLETAVRDRARQLPGSAAGTAPRIDIRRVADELGDRVLVEFVENRGELHAVTIQDGRARLHQLGPIDRIDSEIRSMRASLQRLARAAGSERSLHAARQSLAHSAAVVGDALLGALPNDHTTVVIVPTGILHGLPWATLYRLDRRPFVVAPSAISWLAAATQPHRSGPTVVAAGPDLDDAAREVTAVAAAHPDAVDLIGAAATVDRVLTALDGAGIAHVAAHGDFRPDNPQLCSLRFADGDLRVYDLERLAAIPPIVVLSACDAGTVAVKAGDELLGFSAAVLRLGASSLVAPMVPVDDRASVALMATLHRHLADGATPADALRLARIDTSDDGTPQGAKARAAAASFQVIGS